MEKFVGQKRNNYLVSDVAPEEGTNPQPFELPRRALVPLPKVGCLFVLFLFIAQRVVSLQMIPKVWDPNTEFAKGDAVMALFPSTTSFYEARVIDTPHNTEDQWYIRFCVLVFFF